MDINTEHTIEYRQETTTAQWLEEKIKMNINDEEWVAAQWAASTIAEGETRDQIADIIKHNKKELEAAKIALKAAIASRPAHVIAKLIEMEIIELKDVK